MNLNLLILLFILKSVLILTFSFNLLYFLINEGLHKFLSHKAPINLIFLVFNKLVITLLFIILLFLS